jgi:hypothetical protein
MDGITFEALTFADFLPVASALSFIGWSFRITVGFGEFSQYLTRLHLFRLIAQISDLSPIPLKTKIGCNSGERERKGRSLIEGKDLTTSSLL